MSPIALAVLAPVLAVLVPISMLAVVSLVAISIFKPRRAHWATSIDQLLLPLEQMLHIKPETLTFRLTAIWLLVQESIPLPA